MDILFDENKARGLAFFVLPFCQSLEFWILQEVQYVVISEIAEHPLNPNDVVTNLISEILHAYIVKITGSQTDLFCLVQLFIRNRKILFRLQIDLE